MYFRLGGGCCGLDHSSFPDHLLGVGEPSELFGYLLCSTAITVIAVAIVVFPTCLLVAALLSKFLPLSSPLWKPRTAAAIGAIAGPFAMYLWAAACAQKMFVPDYRNAWFLAVDSAIVGTVFAFSYARLKQT